MKISKEGVKVRRFIIRKFLDFVEDDISEYISKRDAEVEVAAILAPYENPVGLQGCFEKIFEHETDNTKAICKTSTRCNGRESLRTIYLK